MRLNRETYTTEEHNTIMQIVSVLNTCKLSQYQYNSVDWFASELYCNAFDRQSIIDWLKKENN